MFYRIILLVVAIIALAGCEAVKEVAAESKGVVDTGSSTHERGESALEEKNKAIDLDF